MRAAQVLLGDAIVGEIVDTDEVVAFRFAESYQSASNRPVLSQYFEDDLGRVYRGEKGNLPVFFANLMPEEGRLRSFLEGKLGVAAGDDFGLLLKVGRDLPGAVSVIESEDSIRGELQPDEAVFAVRRYDRLASARIHQEDFAQVVNVLPKNKYEFTYEKCAVLLNAICDIGGYDEFVKRLVFVVASGNGDAHLKNWSLLYPDGVRAELTPL